MNSIIERINTLRKANNNGWYNLSWDLILNNTRLSIRIKGYKTWLQVFDINGIDHSNNSDQSVKQFKLDIKNAVEYTIK